LKNFRNIVLIGLFAFVPISGHAQSPGTVFLSGPSTGGLTIVPSDVNTAVNAALVQKADAANPVISGTLTANILTITGNSTFNGNVNATNGFLTSGSNTTTNAFLFLNGTGSSQRGIRFLSGGSERWRLIVANNETSVNNGGSDLILQNYTDTGAGIGNLLQITRATGLFTHNAAGLFHYISTADNDRTTGFTGWTNQTAGRGGRIGLTGQASNSGYVYTAVPGWTTGTAYSIGSAVMIGYNIMTATSAGTSGPTTPTCKITIQTCSDGALSWVYEGVRGGGTYQVVGAFASGNMTNSYGGTPTGRQGVVFGFNTQANISVANGVGVVGYENNFGLAFPAYSRIGEQIISGLGGTQQGTIDDVGWRIGSQRNGSGGGAAPLKTFMAWGGRTTGLLLDPNGYGLRVWGEGWNEGASGPTMMIGAGGLDLQQFQATGSGDVGGGFIIRTNGAQILNGGDIQSNYALLHNTATGSSLDVSQYRVTAAALHSGGGGTTWTSSGWLADCTDGSIIKTTSVGGGTVTGIALFYGAFSSTPTTTVVCKSEHLIGVADDAGNPTLPDTITVDMTSTQTNGGVPVLTLGGVANVAVAGTLTVGGGITMTSGQIIDLKGGTTPGRYLAYDATNSKLKYYVNGTAVWSIDDSGNVRSNGTFTPNVTP
jgi:hypothetical protein